jgi:hypothetical protein
MSDNITIQSILSVLGPPAALEQDPRAGISAVWGTRKTGCFTVSRGPIDEAYEVALIPATGSSPVGFFKGSLTANELNDYVSHNLEAIKSILEGR